MPDLWRRIHAEFPHVYLERIPETISAAFSYLQFWTCWYWEQFLRKFGYHSSFCALLLSGLLFFCQELSLFVSAIYAQNGILVMLAKICTSSICLDARVYLKMLNLKRFKIYSRCFIAEWRFGGSILWKWS